MELFPTLSPSATVNLVLCSVSSSLNILEVSSYGFTPMVPYTYLVYYMFNSCTHESPRLPVFVHVGGACEF